MSKSITYIIVALVLLLVSGSHVLAYNMPVDSTPPIDSSRVFDSLEIQNDSILNSRQIILMIGHINFDHYPDTVIGKQWQQYSYMPTVIRWGRKNDTLPEEIDSAHYVPDSLKVPESAIIYPAWQGMRGNITFDHINVDSLQDLLFAIRGHSLDTPNPVSYKRMILLFGQDYLDTMSVIDISSIDSFQFQPFIAINIQPGKELLSPAHRDVSKGVSYYFPRMSLNVRDTNSNDTSGGSSGRAPSGVRENSHTIRIYPNPAAYFTNVEAIKLPLGDYIVEIINSAGMSFNRQEVHVESNGELLQRLDLAKVSTGYYLIKVQSNRKLYGVYQILIIH